VWRRPDGKPEISHDWLAGIGVADVDRAAVSSYSGSRTTYKVDVNRVTELPDVAIGEQFAAAETKNGERRSSACGTPRAPRSARHLRRTTVGRSRVAANC
jgi:hypothetical protein